MIKSNYKKRKRSETALKKGATVATVVGAGYAEAKTGFKTTKLVAKGVEQGAKIGSQGLKSVKDFASGVSKTFKETMNPPAPKKIPKSHRLNAGNIQHDKLKPKQKLLGAGTGVDKPATIHTPKPSKPVTKGQGGRPKPPKMHVPRPTGGFYGDGLIGGRKTATQTLPTTGMPKGPGTTTGSFKPNLTLDSKMQSDMSKISSTKKSATTRSKNLITNAPSKGVSKGMSLGQSDKIRAQVAEKVKGIRKRATNKVTKIQKQIDTRAAEISKKTGRPVESVKKFNKSMTTQAGKNKLDKAFLGSRGIKPKVKLNAAAMLNPAGIAIDTALQSSIQKNPEKYTKGIFGGTVAKKSIPGFISQTKAGKKAQKKISGIKSRFKF
jgi:hypothetical protein